MLERNSGFQLGDFQFLNGTINRFTSSSRQFLNNITRLYEKNLYMSDLYKLLDTKEKIVNKENAVIVDKKKGVPKIEFKNISFVYPDSKKKVFENLNIEINPGEDIALVGENGAGKSTFIKLLLRFYDATEGEILINWVNLKYINLESYYENISVLFQDFNQYYYKVTENISVGDITKSVNKDGVLNSSKRAGSHNFIKDYKKGYGQILAKSFKGGIEPSWDQWQRIALARAFYRNANILILDEPTAAIDAVGEFEIFKEIEKVKEDKTTIIISHRFSTVRNADKIYVIEHGKILEHGSHEKLMSIKNGQYKKMFELQSEGYK